MPRQLEDDFKKAFSDELPEVTSFMLAQFFRQSSFIAPELRNVKTKR